MRVPEALDDTLAKFLRLRLLVSSLMEQGSINTNTAIWDTSSGKDCDCNMHRQIRRLYIQLCVASAYGAADRASRPQPRTDERAHASERRPSAATALLFLYRRAHCHPGVFREEVQHELRVGVWVAAV